MANARRSRAAAVAILAAVTLTGCIILPPPLAPAPLPTQPAPQPQPTQSAEPTETLDPSDRVQPDEPVSETDPTADDVGEYYAGEAPITSDGYSPDAATDVVLQPTRGTPLLQAPAGLPDSAAGDEYLPDVAPSLTGDLIHSTVGRLEMTDDEGGEYTCSGTVVNSGTQNVVITAAHCVFSDDTRSEMARITFTPAYDDGDAPFGVWEAEDWWYPEQYITANDRWLDGVDDNGWMGFDFGYLRLAPNDQGQEIEDVVGGQGVSFMAETNGIVLAGYPADPAPFDGEVQRLCSDSTVTYGVGGDPNLGVDCTMGGGASGSGWVSNVDPATGAGLIVAVYSNGGTDDAYGPPLGITAYDGLLAIEG
ncbi:hypothetical protein [Agrococcus versicolor]